MGKPAKPRRFLLTSLHTRVILELLKGASRAKAAERTGVSLSSIHRWWKSPIFRSAYKEAERVHRHEAARLLAWLQVGDYANLLKALPAAAVEQMRKELLADASANDADQRDRHG